MAHEKQDIESMIEIEEFTDWAQLKFNTSKCASLNSQSRKYVESYSPILDGKPVPALKWEQTYKYLGVQFGRTRISTLTDLSKTILAEAELIAKSLLADWQKVEAINIFVLAKAQYHLLASTLLQNLGPENRQKDSTTSEAPVKVTQINL